MDKKSAETNVATLIAIIPKSFAIYGTALGMIREGGVIAHDQDTDIGIFSEDFSWDMINRAVGFEFDIISIYGMRHHGLEISLRRNGVKTDIIVFYREGDKVWNSLWDNGARHNMADEIRHEYPASCFKTKTIKLQNGVPIATLGEEYLKVVYGDDWKIPVKEWDWRTSHKCRKI
jgi:hypothetical protein